MTKQEFKSVIKYLSTMLPDLGTWIQSVPLETIDLWFTDVFATLELHDVRAAISAMAFEGLKSFDRDRLPFILSKSAQDIAFERTQRQGAVLERERRTHEKAVGREIRATGQYKELLIGMAKYRDEHNVKKTPPDVIHDMTESIFEDMPDDDDQSGTRYRCLKCDDSGFINYRDHKGKSFAGHCDCDKGEYRRSKFTERGRTLGAGAK